MVDERGATGALGGTYPGVDPKELEGGIPLEVVVLMNPAFQSWLAKNGDAGFAPPERRACTRIKFQSLSMGCLAAAATLSRLPVKGAMAPIHGLTGLAATYFSWNITHNLLWQRLQKKILVEPADKKSPMAYKIHELYRYARHPEVQQRAVKTSVGGFIVGVKGDEITKSAAQFDGGNTSSGSKSPPGMLVLTTDAESETFSTAEAAAATGNLLMSGDVAKSNQAAAFAASEGGGGGGTSSLGGEWSSGFGRSGFGQGFPHFDSQVAFGGSEAINEGGSLSPDDSARRHGIRARREQRQTYTVSPYRTWDDIRAEEAARQKAPEFSELEQQENDLKFGTTGSGMVEGEGTSGVTSPTGSTTSRRGKRTGERQGGYAVLMPRYDPAPYVDNPHHAVNVHGARKYRTWDEIRQSRVDTRESSGWDKIRNG